MDQPNPSLARSLPSRYAGPDQSPGFLLWQVTNAWQRRQRAALAPLGLTHVQFVLLAGASWLTRADEALTQIQLARHTRTDVMMTSQVLRTLETKGLLGRSPHLTDARAKLIAVTPAGHTLAVRATAVVEAVDAAFFAALEPEQPGFTTALRRLAAAE